MQILLSKVYQPGAAVSVFGDDRGAYSIRRCVRDFARWEEAMIRIRRFGIVRTATVLAVLYAVAALIFFGIFAIFILLVGGSQQTALPGGFDMGAGIVGILIGGLILSAFYGLFGWIFTAIFCLLYNWVAGFTGGVEFELKAAPSVTAQPTSPSAGLPPSPVSPEPPASPPAAT